MRQKVRARGLLNSCVGGMLLLGTVCTATFAVEFAGGTGEPNDPYRIATREQLLVIGSDPNLLDKHFELVADIDLDPNLTGGGVFNQAVIAPPGEDSAGPFFTGRFNGKGHAIRHLTMKAEAIPYMALFGRIGKAGSVHDLTLTDIDISNSADFVAGLAGYNRGVITNCRITGSVSAGAGEWCAYLGLVAGRNSGRISRCDVEGSTSSGTARRGSNFGLLAGENWGTVSGCTARGVVNDDNGLSQIGGMIGRNVGSMADCRCDGTIASCSRRPGGGNRIGGLVGWNEGSICRCFATGSVTCDPYGRDVGGLVGLNTRVIVACYATGDCAGKFGSDYGGLVGQNGGSIVYGYARGKITGDVGVGGLVGYNQGQLSQCHSGGQVALGQKAVGLIWQPPVGGLAGLGRYGKVIWSFWDMEASGTAQSEGGTGLTTAQMQNVRTFLEAGWDFTSERANGTADMWAMGDYPALNVFDRDHQPHKLKGTGTADDPYRIATAEDLGAINHHDSAACYRLTADIDMSGVTWTVPVIPSFEGRFDGNGFSIRHMHMQGQGFLGLFGVLWTDAVVENLAIENARIVAGDSASDLGILAATNRGRIVGCRTDGTISAKGYKVKYGGMVANNDGTIADCDPVSYSGPRTVIVDLEATAERFLKYCGQVFEGVWVPSVSDLDGFDAALKMQLDQDTFGQGKRWLDREYILANLPQYNREYSGCIKNGAKCILCQMHVFGEPSETPLIDTGGRFSAISDGGCGVIWVVFDAQSKGVISLVCNGS